MNFEESTINTIHQQSGFDQLYIEKVLRLLEILELFFSHPVLKDKYALKGGTALNLFYFNLPRLSVVGVMIAFFMVLLAISFVKNVVLKR